MVNIYLIRVGEDSASIRNPIKANQALTLDRDVWLWGSESQAPELDLPDRGDIIVFYELYLDVVGVGEVWESSTREPLRRYYDQIAQEGHSDAGLIITLVNHQEVYYSGPELTGNLLDIPDEGGSTGQWIEALPDIYRVPEDQLAGVGKNTRFLIENLPVDSSEFGTLPPVGGDPQEPERGIPPDDGNGGLDSIDWTGPLLAQQYASRDAIQEAAKGTVQIIILLFGIMIAALSVMRKTPSQAEDAAPEALSITHPLVGGLLGIGMATLLSALLLTITAARPRPFSRQLAEKQNEINSFIERTTDPTEKSELLRDYSIDYHEKIKKLQRRNGLLGAGVGAAIGLAIASMGLFGYETLVQLYPKYSGYWSSVYAFVILSLFLIPVGYFRTNQHREEGVLSI